MKLVEAAPVAGALRFELISEGRFTGKARGPRKGRTAQATGRKARGRTTPRTKERRGRASA